MSEFFAGGLVKAFKDKVLTLFSNCQCNDESFEDQLFEIKSMFEVLEDPFESISSEYRRLKSLKVQGYYIPPEPYLLGHADDYEREDNDVNFVRSPAYGQQVPLLLNSSMRE